VSFMSYRDYDCHKIKTDRGGNYDKKDKREAQHLRIGRTLEAIQGGLCNGTENDRGKDNGTHREGDKQEQRKGERKIILDKPLGN